jgi:hypothetical protein
MYCAALASSVRTDMSLDCLLLALSVQQAHAAAVAAAVKNQHV